MIANKLVSSKMHITSHNYSPADVGVDYIHTQTFSDVKNLHNFEGGDRKRKLSLDDDDADSTAKRTKVNAFTEACENSNHDLEKKTDLKVKQTCGHKIRIGNLYYPAHPYTVHVTNLSSSTEDMDLVDLFRRCGAIVHARIFREKQTHPQTKGKSKCAGLVQFEERESVEKALTMSGEVGLHEKLVTVERSHQPAVGLVPPGMHRTNPRGEGKHSKLNEKRKERRLVSDVQQLEATVKDQVEARPANEKSERGILAFRPRGVSQARKMIVSLPTSDKH